MGKTIRKSSFIWKYFVKDELGRQFATCMKCRKIYKTSGNTTNLTDHLKRAHKITKDSWKLKDKSDSSLGGESTSSNDSTISSASKTLKRKSRRQLKQHTLRSFMKAKSNIYQEKSSRKRELDLSVTLMIAKDMQPFSVVNDVGFQKLCEKLDPRYILPSSTTIKNRMLPELYSDLRSKLADILKNIEYVSLTTDAWTCSFTTDSYLTITIHFIHDYELKSCVLETEKLEDRHTGENLANTIEAVLNKWNLREKVICIVTDNASNMKAACNQLKISHLGCFAHTINLVVEDGIKNTKNLGDLIKKCKNIVTHFKKSARATENLKSEQRRRNEKELKLLQDVDTRWNSTFYMIKRILEVWDALSLTLINLEGGPDILNVHEKTVLSEVVLLLELFENATKQVSGNFVTISLIIPIIKGLYINLNELKENFTTPIALDLFYKILSSVNQRLMPYEKELIPSITTILDPRFKKMGFKNQDNSLSAHAQVQKMAQALFTLNEIDGNNRSGTSMSISDGNSNSEMVDKKKKNFSLFGYLKEKEDTIMRPPSSSAIISVRSYMETEVLRVKENPLLYWKSKVETDVLKKIALKYLAVPATSVPSERLFSKAGQTLSARRSRLKPQNVNSLLFINANYDVLDI